MFLNRKMIRRGLLCLLATVSLAGKAQKTQDSVLSLPTTRYLTLGIGGMYVQLSDEHMSPLNYYGGALNLRVGALKRKNQSLRNFTISTAYTHLSPKQDNREIDPQSVYFRLDLAYAQQHYVRSFFNNSTRWYLGGKIRSHANIRMNPQLDGAFVTFIFANGLFLSNVLERELRISGRPFTLNWQVDLPIINHTIRPDYLNIYDFVNPENNWVEERVEDGQWRSIATYSNITSTISLLYPISTTNAFRFSYEWDFYRIHSKLKATNATHTYLFSFLFHF
ncbi:MAG: hypothetical protein AAGC64_09530 [Bacteroidota bacterium]